MPEQRIPHAYISALLGVVSPTFVPVDHAAIIVLLTISAFHFFGTFLHPIRVQHSLQSQSHTIAIAHTASECIFNMDMSDLCGRTIKVSLAQQNQLSKLTALQNASAKGQAIWSSDQWFQEHVVGEGTAQDRQKAQEAHDDKKTLQD